MKSIRIKLLMSSLSTILVAFVVVFVIVYLTLTGLVDGFLNISKLGAEESIAEMKMTSNNTKEKIGKFFGDSLRAKGNTLLDKDMLVIKPPFLENSYSVVKDFLLRSFRLDEEVLLASFFTINGDKIKSWQVVTKQVPQGIGIASYDNSTQTWNGTLGDKQVSIQDPRVLAIANANSKSIELIDYPLRDEQGQMRTVKAYDAFIPVFEGEGDVLLHRKSGETIGYLRYVITLEKMQNALAQEELLLSAALQQKEEKSKTNLDAVIAIGLQSQKKSIVILAASAITIVLVAFFIALFLSGRITQPIRTLTNSAQTIARGDYTQPVAIESNDEIGLLGDIFEEMRTKVKAFTGNLQELVDQRTQSLNEALTQVTEEKRRIQSLLDNIKIGILTFGGDLRIEEQFSAYLGGFYQTDPRKIAGSPVVDFIFPHTTVSNDKISTMVESLRSMAGEDAVNWTFNSTQLVTEAKVRIGEDDKIIALDWNPLLGTDGQVAKVMLSVRDLTEQRKLEDRIAKTQKENQRTMSIVGDLIKVKHTSALSFFKDSMNRMKEIYVELVGVRDPNKLFANLHTIKGVARNLHFNSIAEAAHNAEDIVQRLRKHETINFAELQVLVNKLNTEVSEYSRVLHEVFAARVEDLELSLTALVSQNLNRMRRELKAVKCELGRVLCIDNVLRWNPDAFKKVEEILMHALNNTVDHGYVLPIRRGNKVDTSVRIHVSADFDSTGKFVHIQILDEGFGFMLDAARKIAQQKAYSPKEDNDILGVLLLDGVSTAETVTKTSGRGVGLSVIRRIAEELKGHVKLSPNTPRGAQVHVFLSRSIVTRSEDQIDTSESQSAA